MAIAIRKKKKPSQYHIISTVRFRSSSFADFMKQSLLLSKFYILYSLLLFMRVDLLKNRFFPLSFIFKKYSFALMARAWASASLSYHTLLLENLSSLNTRLEFSVISFLKLKVSLTP